MRQWTVFCIQLGLFAALLQGCETEDLGRACDVDGDAELLNVEAVANENVNGELTRLKRDGACQSFVCIEHRGYAPYCSRKCSFERAADGAANCASDADCDLPLHCFEGSCRDDDCPAGFRCGEAQDIGPLDEQLYCVYQEGCSDNNDCESFGNVACQQFGCANSCALDGDDPNDSDICEGKLSCRTPDELNCNCQNSANSCPDEELLCQPQGLSAPLPAGSVQQRSACQPVDL